MIRNRGFKVAALAASIALAMGSTAAMAAGPATLQLPGKGTVSGTGSVTAGTIANGAQTITVSGNEVINWGTGTDINTDGAGGFNIGSGAALTFSGNGASVLNIDSSGNASQIFGALTASGTSVFVANANGIIVGSTAQVSSNGYQVGLIANTLSPTAAADFAANGFYGNFAYNGTGGDVTVQRGAAFNTSTIISGGGTVNVNLNAFTSTVSLSAGVPSSNAGAFAVSNANAALNVNGQLGGSGSLYGFTSAGTASNAGVLDLNNGEMNYNVAGVFTNTGILTLAGNNGAVHNKGNLYAHGATFNGGLVNDGFFNSNGSFTVSNGDLVNHQLIENANYMSVLDGNLINATGAELSDVYNLYVRGSLTNAGTLATIGNLPGISVEGGDLTNSGTLSGAATSISVTNGSITNTATGVLDDIVQLQTVSDSNAVAGSDYSVTNAGLVSGAQYNGYLRISANAIKPAPDTTGSFTNTGTINVVSNTNYSKLGVQAGSDVTLQGAITVDGAALSASNPLLNAVVDAESGVLVDATPLYVSHQGYVHGGQAKVMADIIGTDGSDYVEVDGGDKLADGYAIRIANGVTVSGPTVYISGYGAGDHPNVILQGKVSGNRVIFGYAGCGGDCSLSDYAVSDVFSGPNGGIVATGENPSVEFDFTGRIKNAPYLNDANFRYNYLPISVTGGTGLTLSLNPVAYTTNGTSNGLSAVNLLVNGDVTLRSNSIEAPVGADGSAVTDALNIPNTHLVLQSTGNISTDGAFYWPGYVYLGTIGTNTDGSAAPGTLGYGMISLGGEFNNVLPGSVANGGGIHFITRNPLEMNGNSVVTNANSLINFGTDTLTAAYASGVQGNGLFFAGTVADGGVVNYGAMDPSLFFTQAPVSAK